MRDFPKVSQAILYTGEMVKIGSFSAPPDAPRFHNTGPIGGYLIVFPRVPVLITHAGGSPIAATPNRVMFYNHGQEYRRDVLSPQGDQSDWFGFDATVIQCLLQTEPGPGSCQRKALFQQTHGPVAAGCFARQRQLIAYLHRHSQPEPMLVEETALAILGSAVEITRYAWNGNAGARTGRASSPEKEIAYHTEQLLAARFREKLTLQAIATEIQYSPFHLSRVFHQQTGQTIHQYLSQLRLRTAYEEILSGQKNFTRLALDLGFTSHSHFTQAFHKTFGQLPSQICQAPVRAPIEKIARF